MALTAKPATQIVFLNEGEIVKYPENITGAKRVILALAGDVIERRHHIKPFSGKRRLGSILPSLLEDSLLDADNERQTVFCTEGMDDHKFFSLSAKTSDITKIMAELHKEGVTPVVAATPLALGLTAFAEEAPSIVIATAPTGEIYAVACPKTNEMTDFRIFSSDGKKWQKEALMTIRSWKNSWPTASIIIEDGIYLPREIKSTSKTIPVTDTSLLLSGLRNITEHTWSPDLQMVVQDTSLLGVQTNLMRMANKSLVSFWAASLIICGSIFAFNMNLNAEVERLEMEKEKIFNTALPHAPMVDAHLQMKRKLNELQLATGSSLSGRSGSLADNLVKIANKASNYDINVRFNSLNLSKKSITLRGRIESLSEVDRLQRMMTEIYPKHKFKLLSAEVNDLNSVNFGLEGTK